MTLLFERFEKCKVNRVFDMAIHRNAARLQVSTIHHRCIHFYSISMIERMARAICLLLMVLTFYVCPG